METSQSSNNHNKVFWKNPIVLAVAIALGYWIYSNHLDHAMELLPYSILLLCPLMHVFMHGKHKHGDHKQDDITHTKD